MLCIGIDTIRFWKEFSAEEIESLIKPYLKGKGKKKWFHNNILCFRHKIYWNIYIFQCSAATLSSDSGSNVTPATPENVTVMIERFHGLTGLDVSDAEISRLDVALMMDSQYPISAYYPLVQKSTYYKVHPEKNGRYLNSNSNEISLLLYDKQQEQIENEKEQYSNETEKQWLRIELRLLRKVSRYLKLGEYLPKLTLADLSYGYGFFAAVCAFERNVVRLLRLKKYAKHKTMAPSQLLSSIFGEAALQMMAQYPTKYQTALARVMDKYGTDSDTRARVTEQFCELSLEPLRQEVYESMMIACRDAYKRYAVDASPCAQALKFSAIAKTHSLRMKKARSEAPDWHAKNVEDIDFSHWVRSWPVSEASS